MIRCSKSPRHLNVFKSLSPLQSKDAEAPEIDKPECRYLPEDPPGINRVEILMGIPRARCGDRDRSPGSPRLSGSLPLSCTTVVFPVSLPSLFPILPRPGPPHLPFEATVVSIHLRRCSFFVEVPWISMATLTCSITRTMSVASLLHTRCRCSPRSSSCAGQKKSFNSPPPVSVDLRS